MPISQDGRVARFDLPLLGTDKACLARYDITEGMSELFEWRLEVVSEDSKIDFSKYFGEPCSITHNSYYATRLHHGRLIDAQNAGVRGGLQVYNLVVRPWLWLLSRATDCRIFQNMTVKHIITQVFTDAGFSNGSDFTTSNLKGDYKERVYTVQYRETHLAFVSRLMEEEGIYYYFEHKKDKHTLVLADGYASHTAIPGFAEVPVVSIVGAEGGKREHLFDWHTERRTRSEKVELKDYNFKQPGNPLLADAVSQQKLKLELFDIPANYKDEDLGKDRAKVRLEAERAPDNHRYANGDAAPLYPGGLIQVKGHEDEGENGQYYVLRSSGSYVTEAYESSNDANAANDAYDGVYELLPRDQIYRAPLVTPRPLVYGFHTATVSGPAGKEIYTDDEGHGRIKVQFHWDRYGKSDENSSCWIRVAQLWAGANWGAQFIPRIGMEVIVTYEEGDPDHPVVVGCLYNGDNLYPYKMPDNNTQSGLKSNSSIGGGGYNEFMFEDKKGEEKIRMHGQKDHEVVIEHDETITIHHDQTQTVDHDQTETVGHDQTEEVKHDETEKVGHDRSTKIGNDYNLKVGANETIKVGQTFHLEAGVEIKLSVGGNFIKIDPSGITINGTMVFIN
jgi:type VI secretion system secreted protein VgrG